MAANLQRRGLAKLGKRFTQAQGNWININPSSSFSAADLSQPPHAVSASTTFRRGIHISAYDKNVDDQIRPTIVPDDVIQPESDKYWAPHPQTGVFGPSAEREGRAGGGASSYSPPSPPQNGSVLEQKAWFRPLEDIEKPPHHV